MYAEITNGKITKIVRAGGSYKNVSFGKNAEDQEYLDAGLYKLVEETPAVNEFQNFGEETLSIDEAVKTVTKSREVLNKSNDEIYAIKIKNINREYETAIAQLIQGTPESEKNTWSKQEAEARAYIADHTASTPLIDGIATARGVDRVYLIGKIIEKADAYTVAIAQLTGARQAKEDQLNAGGL
ncbi:hypothetical protein [Sulfurimonas sp.]|uniref:hypothetical protein n=1 Tax=Sulfurimonas sp. TaxID=2022749 RepID=UPI00260DC1E7|nr:hypothetical protein [Sulfurimonas sp.]MDD3452553.1 hypothetical protein [Sulfurimonas sp.]